MTEVAQKQVRAWPKHSREFCWFLAGAVILLGIGLRFWHIAQSDFVFYDEGYYLNFNRQFGQFVSIHPPRNPADFGQLLYTHLRVSLGTGKALWFFLSDLRIFWGGQQDWFFPRVLSAVFGVLTLFLLYLFGRKFYNRSTGLLAATILAVFPSHVFYSRLALQEALSTLVVLLAFYLYVNARFSWKTFAAGLCFALGYFSNYRLTVLPVFIIITEAWLAFADRRRFDLRKCLWCLLMFCCGVFLVGAIDNGLNTRVVFSWLFHQTQLAQEQVAWVNIFSYPYYLFRLDNPLLGLLFFANFALFIKGERRALWPFVLVLAYMFFFSWASEKGARYLCVMLPFAALSVAHLVSVLWQRLGSIERRMGLACVIALMFLGMAAKSLTLAASASDYRRAAEYLLAKDRGVKLLSTQNYVQGLFLGNAKAAVNPPKNFEYLLGYYQLGYRYILICPQAFISWTPGEVRFSPGLEGYMGFVLEQEKPLKIFPNFSPALLERFVFEHNQNLGRSLDFLKSAPQKGRGEIRIYDLGQVIRDILDRMRRQQRPQEN